MRTKLLTVLTSCLFFISCSNSYELEYPMTGKQEKDLNSEYTIEMDEAIKIATQALNKLNGSLSESRNTTGIKKAKQVITYPAIQSRVTGTSLYIVNFEGGGFAIVPADDRATDVYAMSDEGEFDLGNANSAYFMNLAKRYLKEELDSISSLDPGISIAAEKPAPSDGPEIYAKIEYNGRECYWYSETTQTTPFYLLRTKWNQGEPYRHFCFTTEGKNAVAGCAPIAMAQIMAYHKKPNSFNGHDYYWNALTQYPTVSETSYWADNVAYLVHDIGVDLDVEYGVEETGAEVERIVTTFEKFGYTAIMKEYAVNEIVSSLDNSNPVYITGFGFLTETDGNLKSEGHAWVIDGYYKERKIDRYYDVETLELVYNNSSDKYYLHCNWGGENDNNCYCLSKVFTVENSYYDRDFSLIYAQ